MVSGEAAFLLQAGLITFMYVVRKCKENVKNGLVNCVCCSVVTRRLQDVQVTADCSADRRHFGTVFTCCNLVRLPFSRSVCCLVQAASVCFVNNWGVVCLV